MGLSLDAYVNKQTTVKINLSENEEISVTFNPRFYTPNYEKLAANLSDDPGEATAQALVKIISDWDFVDAKGKKLPITLENLEKLDITTLNKIMSTIIDEALPNQKADNS